MLTIISRFCDFIHQNSEQYLRSDTFGTYIRFMEWLLDGSGIRRLNVTMARFRRLQMLYKYKIGSLIDQTIVDQAKAVSLSFSRCVLIGL